MHHWKLAGFIATAVIVFAIPIYIISFYYHDNTGKDFEEATYIGREQCKSCHAKEYNSWRGSHHDKAMDMASDSTVLGDFNDVEFESNDITSTFFKRDGKFFVRTNGPGGTMGEFEITHTFGFTPLQQYLVPFENGRYQCLPIAWDTEKKKWFSLVEAVYGKNIPKPSDWLYWTNNGQNWNGMCAECHSTNLQKNFNTETKTYHTTYSEIDVSCEACHGPGSKHEAWANLPEMARPADRNFDLIVKTSNIDNRAYVDLCGYCHSRRSSLGPLDFSQGHLMNMIVPQVLDENYFPDGQILEEDYVYGSFTQSKMFANDVRCNDCHDVHSGKRLFEGNALCAQCHQAEVYDSYSHHFHKKTGEKGKPLTFADRKVDVGEGALCVNCHMPGRYYMGNDFRNDHSLRIPRPDLSLSIGTPNACTQCHEDQSSAWADKYITTWYGQKRKPHFGFTFAKGRKAAADASKDLVTIAQNGLYPPIVRATAVSLLMNYHSKESFDALIRALNDDEPLVRYQAVKAYRAQEPELLLKHFLPLLQDPLKSIRIDAAFKLSYVPEEMVPEGKQKLLRTVLDEYMEAMKYSADFAASRHNLAIVNTNGRHYDLAVKNYYEAIEIDSLFYPAKVNLSMLLNQLGRNDEAEYLLRDLIKTHPEFQESYYFLGLLLTEKKDYEGAVSSLKKASELLPDRPRIFYNLGLLFQYLEKNAEAEKALLKARQLEPNNLDFSYALADHYIKTNNFNEAKKVAELIKQNFPDSDVGEQILNYLNNSEKVTQ